ncbi:MAG: IS256 family transposase, partial [Legionella sp.]
MKNCNLKGVATPVEKTADPLTELLRNGARDLIRQAVEAELGSMLSDYEDLKLIDGRQAI